VCILPRPIADHNPKGVSIRRRRFSARPTRAGSFFSLVRNSFEIFPPRSRKHSQSSFHFNGLPMPATSENDHLDPDLRICGNSIGLVGSTSLSRFFCCAWETKSPHTDIKADITLIRSDIYVMSPEISAAIGLTKINTMRACVLVSFRESAVLADVDSHRLSK